MIFTYEYQSNLKKPDGSPKPGVNRITKRGDEVVMIEYFPEIPQPAALVEFSKLSQAEKKLIADQLKPLM